MFKKLFRKMIVTQILTQLTVTLCMLIDSIMIGQFLGVDSVAAYGFASPVLLVFTAIGMMLSAGIQVAASNHMGKGDTESINKIYSSSIAWAVGISVVGIVAILIFVSPLATLLGAEAGSSVHGLTQDYLLGFLIGIPAFLVSLILLPFLQMSGKQTILIVSVIAMTIGDVALDFLVAKVGLFGGGIFGMGMASALSYVIAAVIAISYFVSKNCPYKFKFALIKLRSFGEVVKGGAATTVNQLCVVFITLIINHILATFGTEYVAAHSVIVTCTNILYAFPTGVGTVSTIFVGIFNGEENRKRINSTIKTGIIYSLGISAVIVALVVIFAQFVIQLFLDPNVAENAEAISIGITALRLMAISVIPCAFTAVIKGELQGRGKIVTSSFVSVMQNFAFNTIFVFILTNTALGAYGIWSAYIVAEVLTIVAYYIFTWVKNKKVSFSISTLALYEPAFGENIVDKYECKATNTDEIIKASIAASEFFKKNGATPREAYHASLAVEELAMNIEKFGISQGSGDTIEMSFIRNKDSWMLNLCDNCENFDPVEYLKLHSDEDPTKHIGIRMISKVVKDAKYINLLGLNNISLKF